ncbi:MAG: metalloprotease TldD [Legionellales bacterium]|nr:metalloprotease TldD [Legionellales bacterium]
MNAITQAKKIILDPNNLQEQHLETIMGRLLAPGIDAGDLYFQSRAQESWGLENGKIKNGAFSIEQGVGVRAISGEKTGFAFCEDLIMPSLTQAADSAKVIARNHDIGSLAIHRNNIIKPLYSHDNPMQKINDVQKIEILRKIDLLARKEPLVKKVNASMSASHDVILIVDHQGNLSADLRPLVRLNISVIVEKNGRRESGSFGGGGRFDCTYFLNEQLLEEYVNEAVRIACINLTAEAAPAGIMPVVLGSGWPGVLLHEAVGHGLEGDFNRKGTSAFSNKIGQRVATPLCTVVDDGTLANRRGSLTIDDEGSESQYTVLIENGILKGYMFDKHNASLMKTKSTGNGRRESYAHLPLPRMTNTYMLAGSHDPAEIIASVEKGIYAVNFDGGQVDITSGKFVFSTSEAYLIEKGKITKPVKGASLIGSGPEVLTKVSMVGDDLALDNGIGTCGKDGQCVPVGVGQPTLKVDELTVGGTKI